MAKYNPTVTTDKGEVLIAKLMAGDMEELEFTRIALSDKDYADTDLAKLTSLEQIKQETLVSEKTRVDENNIIVHGIIYNTDLLEGYNLKTIGLYAADPDEGEILYSVTTAIKADYITEADEHNIGSVIVDLMTKISKAPVSMKGNPSALVDVFMLNKKLNKGEGLEENFNTAVKIVTELKKKQNETDNRLLTTVKTIWGAINELFNNKLEKGGYVGNAKNLNDEISKVASKTTLGRIIVGDNLTVDTNGRLSGNPGYTHPIDPGNKHIPAGGTTGQFLKWLSSGVAQWATIAWGDITGKPNTFPPEEHTHNYEPVFNKNSAFNKNFGTVANTVLDGAKLAETLGIPYGGSLNTTSAKVVGTAYYDSTTKKTYKCIVENSLNYADASYFEAISNNDLLLKLQNFNRNLLLIESTPSSSSIFKTIITKEQIGTSYTATPDAVIINKKGKFLITLILDHSSRIEQQSKITLTFNNNNVSFLTKYIASDHWGWNYATISFIKEFDINDIFSISYYLSNANNPSWATCIIDKLS